MEPIAALLDRLARARISVCLDGDTGGILWRGPKGALDDATRALLMARKAELVAAFQTERSEAVAEAERLVRKGTA